MANATIRDVAKRAGVGVGTVSRVLNDSTAVSSATRQKVQTAIAELNYSPSPIARRLSLGRTMTIGVIAPFFIRPSYVERLRGVEAALSNSEYDFIIYNVETVARRNDCFHDVPRQERVDGLLIMTLTPTDEEADYFVQSGMPTVLIDSSHRHLSHVMIDDVAGGYQATQHLIDLGHRKIGYISDLLQESPFGFRPVANRYEGYLQALAHAGIEFYPEYHRQGELSRREARRLAHELLTLPDPPTAIFAYSDTQAFGVLRAAQDLGLKVPEQLSVIGYDDIEIAEFLHLTTIRQHLYESGVRGAELLLGEISNPLSRPQEIVLPTTLVERDTTAPPLLC
ncbi:MAG: LacI family DNA-binding transcriptional regulator [Chloroflexi bacterium]|nr:LacI family DNA-binding transcriptional regulator [Ardenticatenaceae bacterium]MBL1127367.1 LacI family transcriptional regulator [Chloroflexota bacterium]NOG33429.1 LacI family DNA-binding transcriptional regulator [Chloroflexota bacterium]GIK58559.1 MAG: LacI family transcriptional regulator [Chloroflexota bacterium]